ncbi:MAG: rhombotarget lipoprotein [Deltaproteobacteria bacterium]|nr:rhombotarget lipoprotein [Deltaproteobacteria bacterium]
MLSRNRFFWTMISLVVIVGSGCGTIAVRKTSNVLDYLYPEGTPPIPARDVTITLPLRVGVAFAPAGNATRSGANAWVEPNAMGGDITEAHKQSLLDLIAEAFRDRDYIASVDPIPTLYLKPGGSFSNLDQLASSLGLNVVVLLSYDQAQFNETTNWSITYWTLVGAYVVKGENNQTQTFVDAAVYDIRSRALLFRTAGSDVRGGKATPVETPEAVRKQGEVSLQAAVDDLTANLSAGLKAFGEQAAKGTVRGQGTPGIEVVAAPDYSGVAKFENGRYTGGLGAAELVLLVLLVTAAGAARRAR